MGDIQTLSTALLAALPARAAELGFASGSVSVEYVLNWGGFVNHSFRATDGRVTRHIKLATELSTQAKLRRWREVHDLLERRYHAPRMLGWITLAEANAAGPAFEWVDGAVPDPPPRELLARILPVLGRLHGDRELAERLAGSGGAESCAEVYARTYDDRFASDLDFVAEHMPPLVTPERLAWMRAQRDLLRRAVRDAAAFQEPADSPTHGDLWSNNLLVTPAGEWFILDWDEMSLGDPAVDLAMLLGPSSSRIRPADPRDARGHELAPPVRERLTLYARASLLDWVIDPLADYIDADDAPALRDRVRAEKERVHRAAVREYEERYG